MALAIRKNVAEILSQLPQGVGLVVVAKSRTPEEIQQAVEAGANCIGENYVQEAEKAYAAIGNRVKWHLIGRLQKNKVKKAVRIFDMIQTIDSAEIAREVGKRCGEIGKLMPVLVQVNIGEERQKGGVPPGAVEQFIREIAAVPNIKVMGLMAVEPQSRAPEDARPYFAAMKHLFEDIKKLDLPGVDMKYLSMGMTGTFKIALEEGANMVRIGTAIFGERPAGVGSDM